MPIIDFKEIPQANIADGEQDTFELFARDFFNELGFIIVESPSRGSDEGKDLLIEEEVKGLISDNKKTWLVSCKHKSFSGSSVGRDEEIDIKGRIEEHNVDGFIAFYSTLPSSGLIKKMMPLTNSNQISIWDREKIEDKLINDLRLRVVFKRYFPESYKKWNLNTPNPIINKNKKYEPLLCMNCGKDILHDKSGLVAFVYKRNLVNEEHVTEYIDLYWACKGNCDRVLQSSYDEATEWEDFQDLSIPLIFMRWCIATINGLYSGRVVFNDEAIERFKEFTIKMSQLVFQETTDEQWERINSLMDIPSWMGGLGE